MAVGSLELRLVAGTASEFKMPLKITAGVEPEKGTVPVDISYSTTPSEKRSERRSSTSPRACSGDMYATVPNELPGLVTNSGPSTAVCSDVSSDVSPPTRNDDS